MVIGVPNVGKSSLINSLRRQHLRRGTAARRSFRGSGLRLVSFHCGPSWQPEARLHRETVPPGTLCTESALALFLMRMALLNLGDFAFSFI